MSLKKFTAKLLLALLSTIFILQMPTTVLVEASSQASTYSPSFTARKQRVLWYYRTYNGSYQKRLWSITHNKWLTDWLPV